MADNFGKTAPGRLTDGGKFYATPSANVAANAIFMPAYSTSPLFGVAEYAVASGKVGAFSTEGTFAFARPDGFTTSAGQAVYYKPSSAVAGAISASSSSGAVVLGYEVVPPGLPSDKIAVYLAPGNALAQGSGSGSGAS